MKNSDVINLFLNRKIGNTKNLRSFGNNLVNYRTTIAYFNNNTLMINNRKYSSTTSKIQNMLIKECYKHKISSEFYTGDYNDN